MASSYRIGGLAVALGIGSAVVVGHGVASAQPPDGATTTSSTESSTSTKTTDDTSTKTTDNTSTKPPATGDAVDSEGTEKSTPPSDLDADDPEAEPTTTKKKSSKGSRLANLDTSQQSNRAADADNKARTALSANDAAEDAKDAKDAEGKAQLISDVTPSAVTHVSPAVAPEVKVVEPLQREPAPKQDALEVASVALAKTVSAFLNPFAGDAPTVPAPIASPVVWTMAAAARRELTAPATDTVPAAITTTEAPAVVAVEQTAPLAWLQQVPILGPVVVTPIVTALHLLPIVSDVIHPFIGFPVQFGLPAGAPVSRDVKVISSDGTPIYVHFMPARGLLAGEKAPTVLNGPGLTLPGATNIDGTILDDITLDATGLMSVGVLRNAGYNVVTWDPRGEWNSGGQLELNSAEFEGKDMEAIINWIATQPEVRLDAPGDPRLGMVGVSYGGGIQLVTAADDKRVDAIVPAITYNRLDTALYKNAAFKSSWATVLEAGLQLTGAMTNPRLLPASIYGDLTGTLSPSDLALLQSRNPDVGKITVPTLLIQGTADTVFSEAEADATAQILIANGVTTKVVWFCGGHGFCANNPLDLRDGALIKLRTLQWLDRYVKGDAQTPTGPQFEWVDQRGQWYSSNTYPVGKGSSIVASSAGPNTLPLVPYFGGSGIPLVPFALAAPIAVNLHVPAPTATTYLVGAPELTFTYSGTGSARHVYAQLVDDRTGLVLGSIVTPIPVTMDGDTHTITIPLEPVSHTLRPGESVTLQLVGSAGLYEKVSPSLGSLNVSSMQLTLPTADPSAVTSESVELLTAS
jgi:ABC-2 type transport system ATP-binding protein